MNPSRKEAVTQMKSNTDNKAKKFDPSKMPGNMPGNGMPGSGAAAPEGEKKVYKRTSSLGVHDQRRNP